MIPLYQDIAKGLGLRVDGDEDELSSKESEHELQLEGSDCERFANTLVRD